MISVLITILFLGFFAWIVTKIPMPSPFPELVIGVLALVAVLLVLQAFGVHVPHVGLR